LVMIAANIEALSLAELQYLAQKEGVDDADILDRDELIEALNELYEDLEVPSSFYLAQHKFINTFVEYLGDDELALLPGVQDLPEYYSETKIHLLFKDPYWAHAYWNISPADHQKLEQSFEQYSIYLKVKIHQSKDGKEEEESFEIEIDKNDNSWNVNLPLRGRTYSVSLHYKDEIGGTSGLLCRSESVVTPKCYWADNVDQLQDEKTFTLLFSSVVTKRGTLVECPMLKEVVETLDNRIGG